MASKLSIDIELNANQYKQAAAQASKSTDELKKSTEDYLKDFGPLRKQLAAAKKEAQNLAAQFMMLSDAEKKSDLGKELAENMDIAIERAAELQDVLGDVNQAIKNTASDTRTWDALKEGMEIGKSATLAYAGAVAKLTGNEESLKDVVATLTIIENGFNTAIKIGNALQKQSAVMTGIRKVQTLAAAKAEEIGAAATGKATIAQKAFNAVAKANPYVLLATAAIAAATAIGGYMLATKKTAKEEKKREKELEELKEAQEAYNDTFTKTATDLLVKYRELQGGWNKLKTTFEKTEFIKKHVKDFNELGGSIKTVNDADDFLIKRSKEVEAVIMKRAKAAAYAAQAQALYAQGIQKSLELEDVQQQKLKEYTEIKGDKDIYATITSPTTGLTTTVKVGTRTVMQQLQDIDDKYAKTEEDIKNGIQDTFNKADNLIRKGIDLAKDIPDVAGSTATSGDGKKPKVEVEVDAKFADTTKINAQLKKKIEELVKTVNKQVEEEFKKNKIDISAILQAEAAVDRKILGDIEAPTWDFSGLSKGAKQNAEKLLKENDNLLEAMAEAWKQKGDFFKAGNTEGVEKMNEKLAELREKYGENSKEVEKYQAKAKWIQDLSSSFDQAGQAAGALGSAFTALGDATDNAGMKAMGIIAETIASLALSFSKALIQAAELGPWGWIAFGIAGMAQLIAMVTQIKSLNTGGYALGGVIPGSSYSGDKLLARVNSGERILTAKQNENLEKIANSVSGSAFMGSRVIVTGVIKGKDLLLVQQNNNKILTKSGTNITF